MTKKYIVKHFLYGTYYCGTNLGWLPDRHLVEMFHSEKEAKQFMKKVIERNDVLQIETLYVLRP
jgi:hypothetical protein